MALEIPFVSEAYDRLRGEQTAATLRNYAAGGLVRDDKSDVLSEPVTDLRAAREKLGLTQAALADRLGLDASRISQWENGKPIPVYLDLAVRALLALA